MIFGPTSFQPKPLLPCPRSSSHHSFRRWSRLHLTLPRKGTGRQSMPLPSRSKPLPSKYMPLPSTSMPLPSKSMHSQPQISPQRARSHPRSQKAKIKPRKQECKPYSQLFDFKIPSSRPETSTDGQNQAQHARIHHRKHQEDPGSPRNPRRQKSSPGGSRKQMSSQGGPRRPESSTG